MFAKPYKLKSNNTLKNSEKKQLVQRIRDEFPSASEEKVKELVPLKGSASCMKVVVSSGETVGVFVAEGRPVLLDTATGLVPTVCALWRLPDLLPTITIQSPVLSKIQNGAPLYLPGVALPAGGVGFPMFARGALLCARTQDNAAAALIGRAAIGSADMLLRAAGVCLETIHVLGDHLCKDPKFLKLERPALGPASATGGGGEDRLAAAVAQLNIQPAPAAREEWPSLGRPPGLPPPPPTTAPLPAPAATPAPNKPKLIPESDPHPAEPIDSTDEEETMATDVPEADSAPEDMDGLLRWCLLRFLRLEGKTVPLPLKCSLLYRNHLVPLCPADRTLDVKKSSYKKLSKFLEEMQQEGLLEVREVEKGVDALTGVQPAHAAVRAHRVPAAARAMHVQRARAGPHEDDVDYEPPVVREMLCVTAAVAGLFPHVKKGSALTSSAVRSALTDHVKSRGLQRVELKGTVVLDAVLAKVAGKQEQELMKWDALMSAVQARMTAATELRFADGTNKLSKSRLDPVTMQVATRSGNKKVTLVSNLEAYGFRLAALSTVCQRGAGASCGVTRSPGARHDQLMLQGDQTHFVAKLLVEKYGLPKKYLEGADKALNKKK